MSARTGRALTETAPLVEALAEAAGRAPAVFHTPGHKRGRWIEAAGVLPGGGFPWAWDGGDAVWAPDRGHDLRAVAEVASGLVARLWGARHSWLLWNGATAGVVASILACSGPRGRIGVSRLAHRSVWDAIVLADLDPVVIGGRWLEGWDIPLPPDVRDLRAATDAPLDALVVVSPTYHGICAPLQDLAGFMHPSPLIVDEAHGAHLAFYPDPSPPHGIGAGAHLVVHGAHKTLPALTQAAFLHWTGAAAEPGIDEVTRWLEMVQSTSPQPALLASLDAARLEMQRHGQRRVARAVELARGTRRALQQARGVRVLAPEELPAGFTLDETRLVVDVAGLGLSGWQAASELVGAWGVWPEMAGARHIVFLFTGADDAGSVDRLVGALTALAARSPSGATGRLPALARLPAPGRRVMRPAEAARHRARRLPWPQASGHVSAGVVAPYPPGIPLITPGEEITEEAVAYALDVRHAGGVLRGSPAEGREVWVAA
ncbi:hypothetical protein U7230_01000 [Carboxydochorda subterranea]|uniref:Arginine decarboxylase n=1 Tax=Carboxydichorda subterranea TaxID=3109565 RepID=A0ABZ1BYQ8_9FIRM|nr:hypothetical protein [Limnochorda sp. L945t]WRP17626.1 hypothetical protein U7230_01000 [Limnochorda sp. L945t]